MAMNCLKCEWHDKPAEVRQDACIACSIRFTKNSAVRYGCNELSNCGQTFESYGGRKAMPDDRDIEVQIHPDYVHARQRSEFRDVEQEAEYLSRRTGKQVTPDGYEYVRKFLYEMTALTDMQLCLLKALVMGVEKSTFAREHGTTPSEVNRIYGQMLEVSPVIRNFIMLKYGTLDGQRGRKRQSASEMAEMGAVTVKRRRRQRKCGGASGVIGTFQLEFGI